jgi:hypothetical protein
VAGAALLAATALVGPALTSAGVARSSGGAIVAVADVAPAPAEILATPSPRLSGGTLPPILPPAGLPTAPPPDAIKPVEPQAGPGSHHLEPVGTRHDGGA